MSLNIHSNRTKEENEAPIGDHSIALSSAMRKPLETPGSRKSSDNEQLVSFLNGVEANPYLDAFYGVLSQVLKFH